jgi:hypothetical protein
MLLMGWRILQAAFAIAWTVVVMGLPPRNYACAGKCGAARYVGWIQKEYALEQLQSSEKLITMDS